MQMARIRMQFLWFTDAMILASSSSSLFCAGKMSPFNTLMATGIFTASFSGTHQPCQSQKQLLLLQHPTPHCISKVVTFRVTTLQTLWNSLTIRGTPDHFNWYSYHACTTRVKVNDQTVKFVFNDNDWVLLKSLLMQLWKFLGNFPWQDFFLTIPWHFHDF